MSTKIRARMYRASARIQRMIVESGRRQTAPCDTVIDFVLLSGLLIVLGLYFDVRYLFSDTVITGGDTASWYGIAHHLLTELLPNGRLSGWDMGNFCGYPNFTFYFIPPFLLAVLPSYLCGLPLTITLKIVIMSGLFLLPVTTYIGLRMMNYRFPGPIMGAAASLIVLMNESYSMFGGNMLSTFAGEFCYMLAFALLPWFMGSFYRGLVTRKGAVNNGLLLGMIGLCHLFVFIPAGFLVLYGYFARKRIRYVWTVCWIGFGVMAFWIVPLLAYRHPYTSPYYMIWQQFVNWRYTAAGLAAILLTLGPGGMMSALRKHHPPSLPPNRFRLILYQFTHPTAVRVGFSGVLTGTLAYLGGQYLLLGRDLWYSGAHVPDPAQALVGPHLATIFAYLILPCALSLAVAVMMIGIWCRKRPAFWQRYCQIVGSACIGLLFGWLTIKWIRGLAVVLNWPKLLTALEHPGVSAGLCGLLVLSAVTFILFSAYGNRCLQRMASTSAPRTFGLYVTLIAGCMMTYLSAHFLNIPDIRFLPPVLLVLTLIVATDTTGRLLAVCSRRTRRIAAVGFCLFCALTVYFGPFNSRNWYRYNNAGYEATPGYSEFLQLMEYLEHSDNADPLNAPRVAYEKSNLYQPYGGDRIFESLPLFSGRQTLEGIHYSSSMGAKYIVFLQTEFSYLVMAPTSYIFSRINPDALPAHFDLYNISQLIVVTPEAKRALDDSPFFQREANFGLFTVYRYMKSDGRYVDVPAIRPVLYRSDNWVNDFYTWYKTPESTEVLLVPDAFVIDADDRATLLNVASGLPDLSAFRDDRLDRTDLRIDTHLQPMTIRFTTNKIGVPHLIKVSYFPNWRVEGAHGVYPVSPHLMLVIPRQREVTLTYGQTAWERVSAAFTGITFIVVSLTAILSFRRYAAWRVRLSVLTLQCKLDVLMGSIESSLIVLRPWLLAMLLPGCALMMTIGALQRNLPARAYTEGIRNYERGTRMMRQKRTLQAEVFYTRAIRGMERFLRHRRNFDQTDILLCMLFTGTCYEQLGQTDQATRWYATITSEYPYSRYVGEAYWKMGNISRQQRNATFQAGLEQLRQGKQTAGMALLHKVVSQNRTTQEYFLKVVWYDPYSSWSGMAQNALTEDLAYFADLEPQVHDLFTDEDFLAEFQQFTIVRPPAPADVGMTGIMVYLQATSDWLDTGLTVQQGQRLRIQGRGSWAAAPKAVQDIWPDTGPQGHRDHPAETLFQHLDAEKALPGVPFGMLIGNVHDVTFPIGNAHEIVMPASGTLFLAINDVPAYRDDNRGGLLIHLQ